MAQPTRSAVDGGWADGPCEAWAFAVALASGGDDRSRRLAMLLLDNAVEIALKTFLSLAPNVRGGPKIVVDADSTNFYDLLDGFDQCFASWPTGVDRAEVAWMHTIRNLLYHRGNGVTADQSKLLRYVKVSEGLLSFLFSPAALERARVNVGVQAVPTTQTRSEVPDLVDEIDTAIERIQLLVRTAPSDAPRRLLVPPDIQVLAMNVVEAIFDVAGEHPWEWQESIEDYIDWNWEVDGVPDDPEEAIEQLRRLRFTVAMVFI